jgi:hypothetical protein
MSTIMNTIDIEIKLDHIVELLRAKGFYEASAEFRICDAQSLSNLRLEFDYRVTAHSSRHYASITSYSLQTGERPSPTATDLFVEAFRQVAEIPTARELQVKEFVNQMEKIKESAEDLGIDGDFMNPLVALMEKLASNALPAPKG